MWPEPFHPGTKKGGLFRNAFKDSIYVILVISRRLLTSLGFRLRVIKDGGSTLSHLCCGRNQKTTNEPTPCNQVQFHPTHKRSQGLFFLFEVHRLGHNFSCLRSGVGG